jgi:transposase
MVNITEHTIGVDISKSHLDVFHLERKAAQRFENIPGGLRALREWLPGLTCRSSDIRA